MKYDVSIIVPVYNAEKYLAQTLGNVLNQSKKEIQVILVNDASTDNSLRIMKDAQIVFGERVIVIDMPQNVGPGAARNAALDVAEGEYIGFVDADDIVDISMYEKLYNIAKTESADIADCAYYRDSTETALIHFSKECCGVLDDKKRSDLICCGGYNCMKIFKKSLLDDNCIRFRPVYILEDMDFLIKALICANRVASVEEILYRYTDGESSLSNEKDYVKYIEAQLSAMNAIYEVAKNEKSYGGIQDAIECMVMFMYKNILVMIVQSKNSMEMNAVKEMLHRVKKIKNDIVKKSINKNRFVKIKLNQDDLKLIDLADTNEKSFFNL